MNSDAECGKDPNHAVEREDKQASARGAFQHEQIAVESNNSTINDNDMEAQANKSIHDDKNESARGVNRAGNPSDLSPAKQNPTVQARKRFCSLPISGDSVGILSPTDRVRSQKQLGKANHDIQNVVTDCNQEFSNSCSLNPRQKHSLPPITEISSPTPPMLSVQSKHTALLHHLGVS